MRRIERLEAAPEPAIKRRAHTKKPTWVPRARRLKLDTPVRYRVKNLGNWSEGILENISQSGVLLHGPEQLPVNSLVEMVFEMPEEISGQKNSNVLCQARIIRSKETRDTEAGLGLAAAILDYKFIHQSCSLLPLSESRRLRPSLLATRQRGESASFQQSSRN